VITRIAGRVIASAFCEAISCAEWDCFVAKDAPRNDQPDLWVITKLGWVIGLMRKRSWTSLAAGFSHREYLCADAVGRFVEQVADALAPLALILFGSLARGDYHQRSDADFCIILAQDPASPFTGYDQVVALNPSGVVQPLVYGAGQFRRMLREANGMGLEVLADGVFLVGDEAFLEEIEGLGTLTRLQLGIERTPHGWRIAYPERIPDEACLAKRCRSSTPSICGSLFTWKAQRPN
jgi:hypothetical protein